MQDHPNGVISSLCAKAGIQLMKGDAALIHEMVPDLDRERVLSAARKIGRKPSGKKRQTSKPPQVNLPKRVSSALKSVIASFLEDHPDLANQREDVMRLAQAEILKEFPHQGEMTELILDNETLLAALRSQVIMLRERNAISAWFGTSKSSRLILRECLTLDLWRRHAGRHDELEAVLLVETQSALLRIAEREFPSPACLALAMRTPIPVEGSDPAAEKRMMWDRLWSVRLRELERACGPYGGDRKSSRKTRILLLDQMFPLLTSAEDLKDRIAELDSLVRARETETAERTKRTAEIQQERRAREARFVRRDELEHLLPATKAETLRWIGDGRIPVAMRRGFRKWGKDLQVSMHDPDLLPEWRARLEDWRRADNEISKRTEDAKRSRRALVTRVSNLVKSSIPNDARLLQISEFGKDTPSFSVGLLAKIRFRISKDDQDCEIEVPIRINLARSHWDPVSSSSLTGRSRQSAISDLCSTLTELISQYRRDLDPFMAGFIAEIDLMVRDLPEDMISTFRKGLEESVRSLGEMQSPSTLPSRLRSHAKDVLGRIEVLHRDRVLSRASGLEDYPSLFREARLMRRKLHLHLGPTNAGKTHAAIRKLVEANTGLYAAPLRLMAMEWAERLNEEEVPTDLVTGEEVIRVPGARHQSVTIEMCPMRSPIDVAIIDEVQMIADPDRGWAWTQAILGLPAREIHLTGSPDAEPWVRLLAEMTGDEVFVHHYERLGPLEPTEGTVSLANIRSGDALIAFSRAGVLRLRSLLQASGLSVATIYGALSPEVRREEARRFRSGEAEVLVATDAIGMGMNLPILRVLFSQGDKFDGSERRALHDAEIRQIAGRAGRFGLSGGQTGQAGAYLNAGWDEDLRSDKLQDRISKAVSGQNRLPSTVHPKVKPSGEVIRLLGELMGTDRISEILHKVHHDILGRSDVFLSGITSEMIMLGSIMDRTELSLEDRYAYACAPVDMAGEYSWTSFLGWVKRHAAGNPVPYDVQISRRLRRIMTQDNLAEAESLVKATSLYIWCALRWPDVFVEIDKAIAGRNRLNSAISDALGRKVLHRSCRDCGRILPEHHRHGICDSCFHDMHSLRSWV